MIHTSVPSNARLIFWASLCVATLAYVVIAVVVMYPASFHPASFLFAEPGDPFGTLFTLWESIDSWPTLTFPAAPMLVMTTTVLARAFGEVASYNLVIFSGYVLTGSAGYLLALRVTPNRFAAFFAGLVLTLSPFHVSRSLQHLGLANLHWLIFFVVALLWFDERPSWQRGGLVGLLFAVTTLDSYQYGLFAMIVAAVFGLWKVGSFLWHVILEPDPDSSGYRRQGSRLLGILVAIGIATILTYPAVRPFLVPLETGDSAAVSNLTPVRQFDELTAYSARWFAYALPSPDNPFFGRLTADRYARSLSTTGSNLTELSLYPGWITLLLALIGLIASLNKTVHLASVPFRSVPFFGLLILAGLYLSFAPTISVGGLTVPTLSAWLYDVLPFIRVYSRFALVGLIGLVGLAAIGLMWLLERASGREHTGSELGNHAPGVEENRRPLIAFALIVILSVLELWALPANHVVAVDEKSLPAAYQALPFNEHVYLAEYPLLPASEPESYEYLLWKRHHGARLLYQEVGGIRQTAERHTLADPSRPNVITALKARGVTHLIVHPNRYTPELGHRHPIETTGGTAPSLTDPRLDLIGQFSDGTDLYRIR